MVGFNFKNATQVAYIDYNIGVCFAVEELEKLGFDCKAYYDYLKDTDLNKKVKDFEDYDILNIEARDYLYKVLGIEKIMRKAYKKVCR